ncbi:hypothetical protein [Carboxylicivirga taeanensis]|uniref:hypothetical protein n=1 Tax=Carboxylicivirga taeanensis TaxID=1416875 RepID=UPI003F6E3FBD
MKRFVTYGLFILTLVSFNKNMDAQSRLAIQKELLVNNYKNTNQLIDDLVLDLIEATNGEVVYKSNSKATAIIKGQLPLVLSESCNDIAKQFNGQIKYKLTISCQKDKLVLTFVDLYHHAAASINGFDFDYGFLQTNHATQKRAIYSNYLYLSEDYNRIHRFSDDQKISSLIHSKTLRKIDQLLAKASQS